MLGFEADGSKRRIAHKGASSTTDIIRDLAYKKQSMTNVRNIKILVKLDIKGFCLEAIFLIKIRYLKICRSKSTFEKTLILFRWQTRLLHLVKNVNLILLQQLNRRLSFRII